MTQPPNNGAWPQPPYNPQNQVPQGGAQPAFPQQPAGYQGQPYQPQAGQPYQPQAGQPYQPQAGQPYQPQAGQAFPPGQPGFAAQPVMTAPPAKKKSKVPVIVGLTLAVALVVGGAFAAFTFFRGSTVRAAKALPSNSVAVIEVNLAPSGEQQLALLTWGKRFPSLQNEVTDANYKKSLYEAATKDSSSAPEWSEVEPWLGDSIAFAAVKDSNDAMQPLVAIATKDRAAAQRFVEKENFGKNKKFDFVDDTLLLWESAANLNLDKDAIKKSPVSEQEAYKELMKRLPAANLGTAYVSPEGMKAYGKYLKDSSSKTEDFAKQLEPLGDASAAFALTASNDTLNIEIASHQSKAVAPGADVRSFVSDMDANSMAVAAVGLNDAILQEMWTGIEPLLTENKAKDALGLSSVADLKSLLGTQVGLEIGKSAINSGSVKIGDRTSMVPGIPKTVVKLKGADITRVNKTLGKAGIQRSIKATSNGDVVSLIPAKSSMTQTPAQKVGSLDSFKKATGDAPAQAIVWLNVAELHTALKNADATDENIDEALSPIASLGLVTQVEDNGQFSKTTIKVAAKS